MTKTTSTKRLSDPGVAKLIEEDTRFIDLLIADNLAELLRETIDDETLLSGAWLLAARILKDELKTLAHVASPLAAAAYGLAIGLRFGLRAGVYGTKCADHILTSMEAGKPTAYPWTKESIVYIVAQARADAAACTAEIRRARGEAVPA